MAPGSIILPKMNKRSGDRGREKACRTLNWHIQNSRGNPVRRCKGPHDDLQHKEGRQDDRDKVALPEERTPPLPAARVEHDQQPHAAEDVGGRERKHQWNAQDFFRPRTHVIGQRHPKDFGTRDKNPDSAGHNRQHRRPAK